MLPTVSNVPTSNAGEGLSNVVRRSMDLSETQYYQIQYLSNDTVVDCSAESTAISDFSVELAAASGTVLAGVKDKEDTASHAGERSGFTTAQSSECHGNKYECDSCSKAFKTMSQLDRHRSVHSESRNYKCDICYNKFKTKSNLARHEKKHGYVRNYFCQECGKAFFLKEKLTSHQVVHSDSYFHICKVCNRGFKRKYDLENHRSMHDSEKRHKCLSCDSDFRSRKLLRQHMKRSCNVLQGERKSTKTNKHKDTEIKVNPLSECNKGMLKRLDVSSEKTLLEKQNADGGSVVSQSRPVVEQSSTSSAHVNALKTARKYDELLNDLRILFFGVSFEEGVFAEFYDNCRSDIDMVLRPECCSECKIFFKYPGFLKQHNIDKHQAKSIHKCSSCLRSLAVPAFLMLHEVMVHPDKAEGRYSCEYCNRKFWMQSKRDNHISNMHSGEIKGKKQYICDFCGKSYKYPSLLHRHQVGKHPDKVSGKHRCFRCLKTFANPSSLRDHQIFLGHYSTVKESYKCKQCDRIFATAFSLARHVNNVHPDMMGVYI